MKYAVITTGGKQYRVSEGDTIAVERLTAGVGPYSFENVLLSVADNDVLIGNPFVAGWSVQGNVLENVRGEKIRVSKFKAKARYRRVTGHRQALTRVQIEKIATVAVNKSKEEKPKKVTRKKEA